jgi:hypothetical protein
VHPHDRDHALWGRRVGYRLEDARGAADDRDAGTLGRGHQAVHALVLRRDEERLDRCTRAECLEDRNGPLEEIGARRVPVAPPPQLARRQYPRVLEAGDDLR